MDPRIQMDPLAGELGCGPEQRGEDLWRPSNQAALGHWGSGAEVRGREVRVQCGREVGDLRRWVGDLRRSCYVEEKPEPCVFHFHDDSRDCILTQRCQRIAQLQ